jgi:hypothetical protein
VQREIEVGELKRENGHDCMYAFLCVCEYVSVMARQEKMKERENRQEVKKEKIRRKRRKIASTEVESGRERLGR